MRILEGNRFVNIESISVDEAYLDKDRNDLPDYPGIYFVFVGKVEQISTDTFQVDNPELIYIGQAKDINARHNKDNGDPKHEHYPDFLKYKGEDKEIIYAVTPIKDFGNRRLIESALIFEFQPHINIADKYSFHHRKTRISISSKIDFPYTGRFEIEQA